MYNSNNIPYLFDSIARTAESTVSSQNSDDDVDVANMLMRRDRRRELHTQAEQRRRDAIKSGYEALFPLINTSSSENGGGSKLSKATILQRTISQIRSLTEQTSQKEKERDNLKNELFALQIMNSNYEEMAKCNKSQIKNECSEIPDCIKFEIFGRFMLDLFDSFDSNTKFDNFSLASTTIIHWVEEYCKPQNLNVLVESILTEVLSKYHNSSQESHMTFDAVPTNNMCLSSTGHMPAYMNQVSDTSFTSEMCLPNKSEQVYYPVTTQPFKESKSFPSSNRRHGSTVVFAPTSSNQPQFPLPHLTPAFESPLDDDIMSMSPNPIDLTFLENIEADSIIDDIWLSQE